MTWAKRAWLIFKISTPFLWVLLLAIWCNHFYWKGVEQGVLYRIKEYDELNEKYKKLEYEHAWMVDNVKSLPKDSGPVVTDW